jgi:hypothetical protein
VQLAWARLDELVVSTVPAIYELTHLVRQNLNSKASLLKGTERSAYIYNRFLASFYISG